MKRFQSKQPFIIAWVLWVAFLWLQAFLIYGPSISRAEDAQIDSNMWLWEFVSIINTFDISPERKNQILNFLSQPETTLWATAWAVMTWTIATWQIATWDIMVPLSTWGVMSWEITTWIVSTWNLVISWEVASWVSLSWTSDIASWVIATGRVWQDIVQDTSIIDTTTKDIVASWS